MGSVWVEGLGAVGWGRGGGGGEGVWADGGSRVFIHSTTLLFPIFQGNILHFIFFCIHLTKFFFDL